MAEASKALGSGLRIALITETWPPEINGVAMTLHRLVCGLQAIGQAVQVVRPAQAECAVAGSEEHVLRLGLPLPGYAGLRFGMPARYALQSRWRRWRPDVVHIATEGPLGWSALRSAENLRIAVTSSFHTNFHRYSQHYGCGFLTRMVLTYLRRFHNHCACTMVPTKHQAAELGAAGFRNTVVLGRGIDTSLFHPGRRSAALRAQWGLGADDLAVLYVGRLAAEKGLDLLWRAFEAIRARRPEARLILVGDGPERERYAARAQVIAVGAKRGEELAAHYASGDVFPFASTTETYGNVITEGLAAGLACVAFDYAGPHEVIRHEANGLLCALGDEAGFIRACQTLATDHALRTRLRSQAAPSIGLHSWGRVINDFLSHLQQAVMRRDLRPVR